MSVGKTSEPRGENREGEDPAQNWEKVWIRCNLHELDNLLNAIKRCSGEYELWITLTDTRVPLVQDKYMGTMFESNFMRSQIVFEVPVPSTRIDDFLNKIQPVLNMDNPYVEIRVEPLAKVYDIRTGEPLVC